MHCSSTQRFQRHEGNMSGTRPDSHRHGEYSRPGSASGRSAEEVVAEEIELSCPKRETLARRRTSRPSWSSSSLVYPRSIATTTTDSGRKFGRLRGSRTRHLASVYGVSDIVLRDQCWPNWVDILESGSGPLVAPHA